MVFKLKSVWQKNNGVISYKLKTPHEVYCNLTLDTPAPYTTLRDTQCFQSWII